MRTWARNVWQATCNWVRESLISVDQALGNVVLGFLKVVLALATGRAQTPIWSDETLSAHCYRAAAAGKPAARLFIRLVDLLFAWQGTDHEVNKAAGKVVTGHCERAYWKEKLRRGLPPEERGGEVSGRETFG